MLLYLVFRDLCRGNDLLSAHKKTGAFSARSCELRLRDPQGKKSIAAEGVYEEVFYLRNSFRRRIRYFLRLRISVRQSSSPQGGELKAHQCQSVCRWVQAHLGPLRIQLQS